MTPKTIAIIVAGGLNTDIIGLGVPQPVGPGELALLRRKR